MSQPSQVRKLLPWEQGFQAPVADPNLIGSITSAIEQGAQEATQAAANLGSAAVSTVSPTAGTVISDLGKAVTSAEQVAGQVASVATGGVIAAPTVTTATPTASSTPAASAPIGGSVVSEIEQAALNAAKSTSASLLPGIEKAIEARVASVIKGEITSVLTNVQGGAQPAVPSLDDFTKADARSRAFRTLLVGLVLSIAWGLVNVIGNIATVDWTNKDALPQVISIAATAIIGSITAYVARILKEPSNVTNATIIPNTSGTS